MTSRESETSARRANRPPPSQVATQSKPLPVPDYPFQMMSSDYFELGDTTTKDCTSKELVSRLRDHVGTFGVMDELATDGASVYKSAETQEFLARFGIRHRVSSTYNLHSN